MRGLKINKQVKRPDTPLAATPEPKINPINGKVSIGGVDLKDIKKPKEKTTQKVATGVRISPKDEKAHPEDFKYLKK
jgi:hypothetical protein